MLINQLIEEGAKLIKQRSLGIPLGKPTIGRRPLDILKHTRKTPKQTSTHAANSIGPRKEHALPGPLKSLGVGSTQLQPIARRLNRLKEIRARAKPRCRPARCR